MFSGKEKSLPLFVTEYSQIRYMMQCVSVRDPKNENGTQFSSKKIKKTAALFPFSSYKGMQGKNLPGL